MKMPQRVCLFGGTFDPIHLGHTHIAEAAVEAMRLDLVVFLPCKQSPHKTGQHHAEEHHRLNMCQLATEKTPWARVDDHDLTITPSYSWITAEAMHTRFPDARLFWLMGTDQWQALPHWNRPEHLASLVEFIVFARGDEPKPRKGFRMHPISGSHPASATAIRNSPSSPLHSSWLAPAVADYLHRHQLYGIH